MTVQPNSYRGFRVTRGDATGPQLAVLVPDTYRVLHFASAADEATDWAVANPTHPTFYVHSETTPATDYVAISHNATSGFINVASGSLALQIDGSTYATLTATTLTLATVDLVLASATGVIVGSATQATVSDGDGATNLIPEVQALGVGTAFAGGAIAAATFNTTNTRAVSPKIVLLKGGAATQVATTALADNEVVGSIIAYGSDGTDFETPVAAIEFVVDDSGGPGTGAIGGSLEFYTTADGGETLTLALTLTNAQDAVFTNGGVLVGSATQVTVSDGDGATNLIPEVQAMGIGTAFAGGAVLAATFNTTNDRTVSPKFILVKGAAATQVATTAVADNEVVGSIIAYASDSGDFETPVAAIEFVVDDVGGPGASAVGGSIEFFCTADGGTTLTERMVLSNVGALTVGGANSGAETAFIFRNTSNDASAGSEVRVSVGGASASGDAKFSAIETGSHELVMGIDASASIAAMGMNATLGANDIIRISDATPPVITYNTTHPTGTFDYVCEVCGNHSGKPFICHDVAAVWHDDVQALVPALSWADQPWDLDNKGLRHLDNKGLRHLEQLGVVDLKQSGNEIVPWVGINLAAAQWYTWSAMNQMYGRIRTLEAQLALPGV